MKARYICLTMAMVAALGLWFGRLAWRAHHRLVTLHARNIPLGEVARALERQTWEKIKYDKKLDAKITLNVKDAPLEQALDLVADRAGARWQKTFAVAGSGVALAKLELVFDGAETLEAAGWTNIAPKFPDLAVQNMPDTGPDGPGPGPGRIIQRTVGGGVGGGADGESGAGRVRFNLGNGGGAGGAGGMVGDGVGMRTMTILPDGTTDQWSAERLVLETSLAPRIKETPEEATPETAAKVASAVHGQVAVYYALARSPLGMGASGPRMGFGPRRVIRGPGPAGHDPGTGDIVAAITEQRRQERLRELSRSPEEQVERARQQGSVHINLQTYDGDNKGN